MNPRTNSNQKTELFLTLAKECDLDEEASLSHVTACFGTDPVFLFLHTAAAQYCGPPNCDQTLYQQCIASGGSFNGSNCSCFPYSPVVIAINGSPYRFTEADLQFDINADGSFEELSWTDPAADVGFLVLDRNGNGHIDNGLELFGNITPQPASSAPNGFAALAVFDDPRNGGNGDGIIEATDAVYPQLRLWIDRNHDGISRQSELLTLSQAGIKSISLAYQPSERKDGEGNLFRYRTRVEAAQGAKVADWAYDVFLTDQPGTIRGSKTPDKIPDDVVYDTFLRLAACPPDATELMKKSCELVRQSVGLGKDDAQQLDEELATFLAEVTPLDRQIADLSQISPSSSSRTALISRRRELTKEKAAVLYRRLSFEGSQKLRSYVASMKTKMKIIPVPTPAP